MFGVLVYRGEDSGNFYSLNYDEGGWETTDWIDSVII